MNGSSTNSVNPPVSSCTAAIVRRCCTQCCGESTWPYIIVELDGSPTLCAVLITSIQLAVGNFPLVRIQRTSSSRISAAVPGMLSSPASLTEIRNSSIDRPVRTVPFITSIGEKACTCICGTRCFTARTRSAIRRTRQIRVDAALHADLGGADHPGLLGAGADLVHRQRVGVRVRAPLGERAEPAAGVADVGEVDVPVHHVGDVVADRCLAQLIGDLRQLVERGPGRGDQGERLVVGQTGRVPLGRGQGRLDVTVDPLGHCVASAVGHLLAQHVPVAVRRVEVRPRLGPASLGVDRRVQVGPPHAVPTAVGLLPGQALRVRRLVGQAGLRVDESLDVLDQPGVQPRLAEVLRVRGEPFPQGETGVGGDLGQVVDLWPRPLGVDVVRGQWRHPAEVVDTRVEQLAALGQVRPGSAGPAPAFGGRARSW